MDLFSHFSASRKLLAPKWLKAYFHVFQKAMVSLVYDCHRSVHMLLNKTASHSLSHKLPWTQSFFLKAVCILLPSDPAHSPYLHVSIVLRICRFPSSIFMKDGMIHGPQTMNNSHFSQHFSRNLSVGLPCPKYYCLGLYYSNEKISKLLVKKMLL